MKRLVRWIVMLPPGRRKFTWEMVIAAVGMAFGVSVVALEFGVVWLFWKFIGR